MAGIAAGVGVAVIGAALWAGIAALTLYRLGLIGVVIGFGVAFVFARFGLRGRTFAILAAALAIAGCALGDIGAGTFIIASRAGVGPGAVLTSIPIGKLMNIDVLDALFYAMAGFAAFRRVARSVPAIAPVGTPIAPMPPPLATAAMPPDGTSSSNTLTSLLPPGPPPIAAMPAPLRRPPRSGRRMALRVAFPLVAIAILVLSALGHQNTKNQTNSSSSASHFQAGDCISGSVSGTVITSADCTGTHDARIDLVLSATSTLCPPGDSEFVAQPPNPSLCMDFNNHNP